MQDFMQAMMKCDKSFVRLETQPKHGRMIGVARSTNGIRFQREGSGIRENRRHCLGNGVSTFKPGITDEIKCQVKILRPCPADKLPANRCSHLLLQFQPRWWRRNCKEHPHDYSGYCPRIQANMSGATIDASLSTMNFGVWMSSLPHVIFSFGTAPE